MKKLVMISMALLLAMTFCAPAWAGRVYIRNSSESHPYVVRVEGITLGIYQRLDYCVNADSSTLHEKVFDSVGNITVSRGVKGRECPNSGEGFLVEEYNVSGAWLPHRKFVVEIESDDSVKIRED